jgi:hypothetical protein
MEKWPSVIVTGVPLDMGDAIKLKVPVIFLATVSWEMIVRVPLF